LHLTDNTTKPQVSWNYIISYIWVCEAFIF